MIEKKKNINLKKERTNKRRKERITQLTANIRDEVEDGRGLSSLANLQLHSRKVDVNLDQLPSHCRQGLVVEPRSLATQHFHQRLPPQRCRRTVLCRGDAGLDGQVVVAGFETRGVAALRFLLLSSHECVVLIAAKVIT